MEYKALFLVCSFKIVISRSVYIPNSCPPGLWNHRCYVNPCFLYSCPIFTDARCQPNSCGGCRAEFYNKENQRIENCRGLCPYSDPAPCPTFPNEDFCEHEWECNENEVCCSTSCGRKCIPWVPPSEIFCDIEQAKQKCVQNPCAISSCYNVMGSVCRPNFCECKAEWYKDGDVISDMECEQPLCLMYCEESFCEGYFCEGHETEYQCVADTCNGCQPRFYDSDGNRIECVQAS